MHQRPHLLLTTVVLSTLAMLGTAAASETDRRQELLEQHQARDLTDLRRELAADGAQQSDPGHQHGDDEGHLPPVQESFDFVSALELGDPDVPGKVADLAVNPAGDTAFVARWRGDGPECGEDPTWNEGGFWTVDVSDPTIPQELSFTPLGTGEYLTEGMHVIQVPAAIAGTDTTILVASIEICNFDATHDHGGGEVPADGGFGVWDVTDPTDIQQLALHIGDRDLDGVELGLTNESHSAFAWVDDGAVHVVAVDNYEAGTDIDIFDISGLLDDDPDTDWQELAETGNADWGETAYTNDGRLLQDFLHDIRVRDLGGVQTLLGSYWDGGYVQLDVDDPANPVFINDTDFDYAPPVGPEPPEGNAHYAEYTSDELRFVGTNEDFDPYRVRIETEQGEVIEATSGSDTPVITDDTELGGPTVFAGYGCDVVDLEGNQIIDGPVPPAPSGDAIALVERGLCTFTEKVANAEAAGYAAVIVFNAEEFCEAFVSMAAEGGIPALFTDRPSAMRILNTDDRGDCAPTPAPVWFAGPERIQTSIEIATQVFGQAETVALARADVYADALAGGPLALQAGAPILLTYTDHAPQRLLDAINALGATNLIVFGGPQAVSQATVDQIVEGTEVADVTRLGGATRFHTAVGIAEVVVGGSGETHAYLTEGDDLSPTRGWPDAMAVSALAAHQGRPILLALTEDLTEVTADALADLDDATIVGGPVAISQEVEDDAEAVLGTDVDRLAGDDRYGTSAAVAAAAVTAGLDPANVWLATGTRFPDSLTGGPAVAASNGVLLLVHPDDLDASAPTRDFVLAQGGPADLFVLGGPHAIGLDVVFEILDRLLDSDDVAFSAVFDGWGWVDLYAVDGTYLDSYLIEEAADPAFATGFGDLSVHEVATDPDDADLAYLSYYSGGARAIRLTGDQISEVGAYIHDGASGVGPDESGNDFWGVEILDVGAQRYLAFSDRDHGLFILQYTGP